MRTLTRLAQRTPFYYSLRNAVDRRRQRTELAEWQRRGRPIPPPHLVKQQTLREYGARFGLRVLVETGTYRGDMVEALRNDFDRIYSIELSVTLHEQACRRFRGYRHISLIQGDSGKELSALMARIGVPTLFWLDGHYSAGVTARGAHETPVLQELSHILSARSTGHVIVIDDARCFGTDPAYPELGDLRRLVQSFGSDARFRIENDAIRITPGE